VNLKMNTDSHEIKTILSGGETLAVEFKSDKKGMPDRELVAVVVALANTEGGDLLLGIEDDGTVTGVHPNHCNSTGLSAMVANRTNPPVVVRVAMMDAGGRQILRIQVPKARHIVATSEGLTLRRRLLPNGKPESVPFYPHEFVQRQSALGLADLSAIPLVLLTANALNPLERQRIREAIRRYGGDLSLLPLADEEFDGALGLVKTVEGVQRPTLAGLLLLGREEDLRQHIPAYEVAFQVLEGTDVRVNEFSRKPLLQTFEDVERLFVARVTENEFQVGLFRVPVPNYDRRAFREALVNALVHRDFVRLGAVHARLDDDGLSISNPGGFVEGVTLANLLVTEPRPRNPLLADIVKRIGLAERTGRGIDRIYEGLLRYGRPAPDYGRSDATSVVVQMSNAESDLGFLEMVLREEERTGRSMPMDSLIILSRLRQERRLIITDLTPSTQKTEQATRATIETLVEAGLVDAHGSGRGRTYTLSAKLYRRAGQKAGYVRQIGFDPIQQEQMVLSYIDKHGSIKRAEAVDLCFISPYQASRLLVRLARKGTLTPKGKGKGTIYERKT
jgi:ATP-dependent DNA helicase RecG